jgi:hypothetical protein
MTKNLTKRLALGFLALGFAGLSSCAYQQVMSDRRAENEDLKHELSREQARGEKLRR